MSTLEDFCASVIDGLVNPKPVTVNAHPNFTPGKVTVQVIQPPHDTNLKVQPPAQVVLKPAAAPLVLPVLSPVTGWTAATMTAEILRNEGGYVNDPSDSGRATNYGITIGFMAAHEAFFGLHGAPTNRDVQEISPTKAAQAYVTYFFAPAHFDQLPNLSNIVMQLYDMAVNMGVRYSDGESQATKVLQNALNVTPVDGVLGASTVAACKAAIAKSGSVFVNDAIVAARCTFYGEVVAAHPEDQKFLDGWKKRANKYHSK